MTDNIFEFLTQIGIGSAIGVIIGMCFQYFFSKKLKIFEEKLSVFRKLHRQLYFVILNCNQEVDTLPKNTGIDGMTTMHQSGLDVTKDLGDALYYVDKDLEKMIENLIYSIYQEGCIIGKADIENIEKIMKKLKSGI